MRALCTLAALVGVALFSSTAEAAVSKDHVIDLSKPLPQSLSLRTGDRVVFVRPPSLLGGDTTVAFERDRATFARVAPLRVEKPLPKVKGFKTVAAFRVSNSGSGHFVLTIQVTAPHAKPIVERIKFSAVISRAVSQLDVEEKALMR